MALIDLSKLTPSFFPNDEDQSFEFKSSRLGSGEAGKKIEHAASGFANSGGGCFIWGIDDKTGQSDGGVDANVGRQPMPDWIDKVVHNVSPPVQYELKTYDDCEGNGTLDADKVLVAVSIHPSAVGPHMANDNKYYIRAGRHTVAANHTLVEALWARRQVQTPILRTLLEGRTDKVGRSNGIYFGVINLTTSPAVDVEIDFTPKTNTQGGNNFYPIRLRLVDHRNPYWTYLTAPQTLRSFFKGGTRFRVTYKDLAGNTYFDESDQSLIDGLSTDVIDPCAVNEPSVSLAS